MFHLETLERSLLVPVSRFFTCAENVRFVTKLKISLQQEWFSLLYLQLSLGKLSSLTEASVCWNKTTTLADDKFPFEKKHSFHNHPVLKRIGPCGAQLGLGPSYRSNIQAQQPHLQQQAQSLTPSNVTNVVASSSSSVVPAIEQTPPYVVQPALSNNKVALPPSGVGVADYNNLCESALNSSATVQQAAAWLQTNRFSSFARTFANFSGLDLLRLSCENLIQICGLPEGIRLYNALHKMSRLTIYLCVEANPDVYHAAYLAAMTNEELKTKMSSLLGMTCSQIEELFLRGPNGIHVVVSDDVVRNFKDESTFVIELLQGHAIDSYNLLLKPSSSNALSLTNK